MYKIKFKSVSLLIGIIFTMTTVFSTSVFATTSPNVPEINLALNKTAHATSSFDQYTPTSNIVDGNVNSYWLAAIYDIAPSLIVDLGGTHNIKVINIDWLAGFAKHYLISVSNDGVNWTNVYEDKACVGGISSSGLLSISGRYVKLYCYDKNEAFGDFGIREFQVMGN